VKAAFIEQCGPPETIQFGDLPEPQAGPGQVVVGVRAVSVNPIDTYIRAGANYWKLPQPFIVGCDFAGVVREVGAGVVGIEPGQRVWGSNQGLLGRQGTFAERIAVDSQWLYPIPEGVDFDAVAAVALVGITAHLGLFSAARIKPGQTLFVRGGSGGVGSMVVQMAKAVGVRVITTAGSTDKAERCRELGADEVIEYRSHDWSSTLAEMAPGGVDVFWETLRTPDFDAAVAAMAERGRYILMAGRDARPPFPVGPFYVKGCSLHGVVMFKASAEQQQQAASDINHWLTSGALRPQIDRRMRLDQAAEAHRLQESSTVGLSGALAGKLVLIP
jgi:NADPH2:quinone reductase